MKAIVFVLILASFLTHACTQKDDRFISNLLKTTANIQSVHYKITQKYYTSAAQDTAVTPYEVWAVRDSADHLRHGYIRANNYYRPYNMFYDKGNFYLTIPPKKVTLLYKHYRGSLISAVDWIDVFLNPDTLQKQISDPKNTVTSFDTKYHGRMCKKIIIRFPAQKNKIPITHTYIFDKKDFLPVWALITIENKTHTLYDELSFSDFTFTPLKIKEMRKIQQAVLRANPIETRKADSETSVLEQMLHPGEKAPLFEGIFYSQNTKFRLSDYIGKHIIIIDFWYTHCPPCVRAIPALMQLYADNKGAGLKIFGVNSVDNQPRSLKNLETFLAKRKVNYDIIRIQPDVDLRYKIKFYPTLYIIDTQGKIVFAEVGYSEDKFKKLKIKLAELLQK